VPSPVRMKSVQRSAQHRRRVSPSSAPHGSTRNGIGSSASGHSSVSGASSPPDMRSRRVIRRRRRPSGCRSNPEILR
jgi:hypothetical protein